MNPPQVYTCSPSWNPSPYNHSGSSQCTSPKHPVSCIEPGLAFHFTYDIIHVSMPFSQIIPPSPSPTDSIRLFYTSVSLLLSRIQSYCYHLSKFHIYALVSYSYFMALARAWMQCWIVSQIRVFCFVTDFNENTSNILTFRLTFQWFLVYSFISSLILLVEYFLHY